MVHPRSLGQQPVETPIVSVSGFDFSIVTKASLVRRRLDGPLQDARRRWAGDILAKPKAQAIVGMVMDAPITWPGDLPQDFPRIFSLDSKISPGPSDLSTGLAALIRNGLVVVRGFPLVGITLSTGSASMMGKEFVRHEEGLGSQAYWPGGDGSGVTIGPGYDLGSRTAQNVVSDMLAVGVNTDSANALAQGAGLTGDAARDWVRQHHGVTRVSVLQQEQLFYKVVPDYELLVAQKLKPGLRGRLFQNEFDAFLSLAWNTSRYGSYDFNRCVDRCDMIAAVPAILGLIGGGPGIPPRRHRETMLLTDGNYILKPMAKRNIDVEYYDDVPQQIGVSRRA